LEVVFLGFVITGDGLGMESYRISTIQYWKTPKLDRDLPVVFGLTNFYRRFMRKNAMIFLALMELLQKSVTICGKNWECSAK
jgi:hypothetical protein